jgi:hypothetical protein
MNKLIKKNIGLITALLITLVCSVVLMVMVFMEHGTMQRYITETEELKNNIRELIKQRPAPVEGNLNRIKIDTENYKKKFLDIRSNFGLIYNSAIIRFAETMEMKPDEFRKKFIDHWEANKQSGATREQIYIMFKSGFKNTDKWDKAMRDFGVDAQKYTSEVVDENNVDEIFLDAFGLERNLGNSPVKCDAYMRNLRWKLLETFGEGFQFGPTASFFSFDLKALPTKESIASNVRCWRIIDDLAKRIAKSGITQMETFEKGSLDGTIQGNYTYYRFTFTVRGDLSNIRRLIDNLYKAYKEHRIYIVRGISIVKLIDEVAPILMEAGAQVTGKSAQDENPDILKRDGMPPQPGQPGGPPLPGQPGGPPIDAPPQDPGVPGKKVVVTAATDPEYIARKAAQEAALKKKDDDPEKDIPFNERKAYGKTLIGLDKTCQAIIDVDYVVYTGEIK